MKTIPLLIILVTLISCKEKNKEENYRLQLKGKESDFVWNFKRNFIASLSDDLSSEYNGKLTKILPGNDTVFYGIDIATWQICAFDLNLKVTKKFGKGGSGMIDESMNFFDIKLTTDKKGYYLISNGYVLKKYYFANGHNKYYKLPVFTNTFAVTGNDSLLLACERKDGNGLVFRNFYFDNNTRQNEHDILELLKYNEDIYMSDLVFEGFFTNGKEYIAYIPYKVGKVLIFNKKGGFETTFYSIDKTPPPKVKEISLGNGSFTYETQPSFVHFIDAAIYNQHLYILSTIDKPNSRSIDIYRLPAGDYMGSIRLASLGDGQNAISFVRNNNHLIVLYENMTMIKYIINTL